MLTSETHDIPTNSQGPQPSDNTVSEAAAAKGTMAGSIAAGIYTALPHYQATPSHLVQQTLDNLLSPI